jgi:phosphoglycolate phosphatase-like HAD superfamily hydrolase
VRDNKVIFWDFDGTLGHRNGFFSEVLVEVLDENEPGHDVHVQYIDADVNGAEQSGIPAILVRRANHGEAKRYAQTLYETIQYIDP